MMKKIFFFWLLFVAYWLLSTFPAFALDPINNPVVNRVKECDYTFADQKNECLSCIGTNETAWTVFGCLPVSPSGFTRFALRFAIGIGGGLAFLAMIAGGFMVITSAGDPGRVTAGKRMITSAALGLLLIIFSLFILRITGREILGLPGL